MSRDALLYLKEAAYFKNICLRIVAFMIIYLNPHKIGVTSSTPNYDILASKLSSFLNKGHDRKRSS